MEELDDVLSSLLSGKDDGGVDLLSLMSRLAPVISALSEDNDETRLISALTPYLNEHRREKAKTAQEMMKIAKLLPLLGTIKEGRNESDGNDTLGSKQS